MKIKKKIFAARPKIAQSSQDKHLTQSARSPVPLRLRLLQANRYYERKLVVAHLSSVASGATDTSTTVP